IEPELQYCSWMLDGVPAGTGRAWTFAARPGDLGRHRVEVVVSGRTGVGRRSWAVLVRPGRPPHVVTDPPPGTLEVASESALRFKVIAEPAAHNEHVTLTTWSIDGAPAGQGDSLTLATDQMGTRTVRARILTDLGASATREWHVAVRP